MGFFSNKFVPPLPCKKCSGSGRVEHQVWKMGKGYEAEGRVCKNCGGNGLIRSK